MAVRGVYAKMEALATCLCTMLTDEGRGDLCACGLVPGDAVALDYVACDGDLCGMAWVRLAAAAPTTGIGVISGTVGNCGSEIGFTVEIGVVRCMSAGDETGSGPTQEEYLAATQVQVADMLTMRAAVACCDIGDVILDAYVPVGPQGMAVGGFWQATLSES
jgi:hypothetical protein